MIVFMIGQNKLIEYLQTIILVIQHLVETATKFTKNSIHTDIDLFRPIIIKCRLT